MKKIPLTQGKHALIDDSDFADVSQYRWHCCKNGNVYYAARSMKLRGGTTRKLALHTFIMDAKPGRIIDHIDGDGLNNQRSNLRLSTQCGNNQNRGKSRNNTSGYKGVYWHSHHDKWVASISSNNKRIYLGYFDDPIEAAKAYDAAAEKYHGRFGKLNFPKKGLK